MTTVSIITPSLNQAKYIARTLKSVYSQHGNFKLEHIVMDGGSNDDTIKILKKFQISNNNRRFIWHSKKDRGQSDAINSGFKLSSGSILCWLNSDDYYSSSSTIQKVVDFFSGHPQIEVVTGNLKLVDNKGQVLEKRSKILQTTEGEVSIENFMNVARLPCVSQPATFFRRQVWNISPLDISLHFTMDWDFLIRTMKNKYRLYKLNDDLAVERVHPLAKTVKNKRKMYQEMLKVYQKHNVWTIERFVCLKNYIFAR